MHYNLILQRGRKRHNSDRSEDGYHSDGDYQDQDPDYRMEQEEESKTIMLRGLSLNVIEEDVRIPMGSCKSTTPIMTTSGLRFKLRNSFERLVSCVSDPGCPGAAAGTPACGHPSDEEENR